MSLAFEGQLCRAVNCRSDDKAADSRNECERCRVHTPPGTDVNIKTMENRESFLPALFSPLKTPSGLSNDLLPQTLKDEFVFSLSCLVASRLMKRFVILRSFTAPVRPAIEKYCLIPRGHHVKDKYSVSSDAAMCYSLQLLLSAAPLYHYNLCTSCIDKS